MHIQILRAEKAGKDLRAARFHQVEQLVRGVIVSLRGRDRLVDVVDDETVRGAVPRLDGRAEEPPVEADRLAVLDKEVLRGLLAVGPEAEDLARRFDGRDRD